MSSTKLPPITFRNVSLTCRDVKRSAVLYAALGFVTVRARAIALDLQRSVWRHRAKMAFRSARRYLLCVCVRACSGRGVRATSVGVRAREAASVSATKNTLALPEGQR